MSVKKGKITAFIVIQCGERQELVHFPRFVENAEYFTQITFEDGEVAEIPGINLSSAIGNIVCC